MNKHLLLMGVATFFAILATPSYACFHGVMSIKNSIENQDVIFTGVHRSCEHKDNKFIVTYSVERLWKGEVQNTYELVSNGNCDAYLKYNSTDKRYLIYADYVEGTRQIKKTWCGRSRLVMPLWQQNISNAWWSLYSGSYTSSFISFFNTKRHLENDFERLGTPVKVYSAQ